MNALGPMDVVHEYDEAMGRYVGWFVYWDGHKIGPFDSERQAKLAMNNIKAGIEDVLKGMKRAWICD